MAETTLETALRTLHNSVSVNGTATDASIGAELVELFDNSGDIVDKQPVSRLAEIATRNVASVVFSGTGEDAVAAYSVDGKMVGLTQEQYDALAVKAADTLYLIIDAV